MPNPKPKLLVIAAHPDDEVLGCAATVSKLVKNGWEASLLILTSGITGREVEPSQETRKQQDHLHKEMQLAAEITGYQEVTSLDFPDNRMDTVSQNDIALSIKEVIQKYRPSKVFTHHPGDYNWDHTICFNTVMMAARANYPDFIPDEILAFEVLSSTERSWQHPAQTFCPTIFEDVADTIEIKKKAMQAYQTEYRAYPHPRSVEGIEYLARKRGCEVGLAYAEAFELIRSIRRT